MAEQAALSFGGLLRQLRAEAQLTQEELAEAAQLSPRSVSDLERGISRTARWSSAASGASWCCASRGTEGQAGRRVRSPSLRCGRARKDPRGFRSPR